MARAQYLYHGLRDYAGALAELEIARRALPNNPRLFELTGYILRRRGQQEEGLQNLERAVELDPRNFVTLQQIAFSYGLWGAMPRRSLRWIGRSRSCPTTSKRGPLVRLGYLYWKADTEPLHQTLMQSSPRGRGNGSAANPGSLALWPNAIRLRPNERSSRWATIHAGARRDYLSHSFGEGLLARMTKDEARARTAFEAARAQQEKIVQAQPDYGPALCVLGLIDAALGRKELALDEGRRAIALTPLEKDVINGSRVLQYFAITAAWAGEKELALQQLEAGLRAPAHRHAELRRLKTASLLGPAPRRSALRKNRRVARAERGRGGSLNRLRAIEVNRPYQRTTA